MMSFSGNGTVSVAFERDLGVVGDTASYGDIVTLVGFQFEEEDERTEKVDVFEEEVFLVDLFKEEEVDDVNEGGLAEVVAVLLGVFWFRDIGEDNAEPLVRDTVEPYGFERFGVVGVEARELHGVTLRRYSKVSFFVWYSTFPRR